MLSLILMGHMKKLKARHIHVNKQSRIKKKRMKLKQDSFTFVVNTQSIQQLYAVSHRQW